MLNTIYTSIIISDYYCTTRSARADSLGSWCSTDEPYLRKKIILYLCKSDYITIPQKSKIGLPVLMLVEILCRNWISTIPLERSQTWRAPDQSGSFHGNSYFNTLICPLVEKLLFSHFDICISNQISLSSRETNSGIVLISYKSKQRNLYRLFFFLMLTVTAYGSTASI